MVQGKYEPLARCQIRPMLLTWISNEIDSENRNQKPETRNKKIDNALEINMRIRILLCSGICLYKSEIRVQNHCVLWCGRQFIFSCDQTKLSGLSQSERSRFRLALWNTEDPFSLGYYFFSRLRIYKYNRYVTTQHTLNMMLYNEIRFYLSCSLSLSLSLSIYFHFLAGFCYHAFSKMILFRNSGWWARCTFVCVSVCIALIAMDLINSNSSNIAIIRVKSRQTADKL